MASPLKLTASILFFLVLIVCFEAESQNQLVLVKTNGGVVDRFFEGRYIHLILKDGQSKEGHIVKLLEFSMITTSDTISFNQIKKVRHSASHAGKNMANKFGKVLILAGAGYFLIDIINSELGYNSSGIDPAVARTSIVLVGSGGLLILFQPRYTRVNRSVFMRTVNYKSPLYVGG